MIIGTVAIVGIVGALVMRQAYGPRDAASAFASGRPVAVSPDTFLAQNSPAGGARTAQGDEPASVGPRVVLPGAPSAAGPPPSTAPAAANPDGSSSDAAMPQAPSNPAVDETALRYFARQGDTKRLNAEIARLRALYPDWYPPTDMTAPVSVPDPLLDQMWKLYSEGRYAAARAAIADRLARQPNWKVPDDLVKRIEIGEARDRLVNASSAKQWNTVVSIAAATPSLLTCSDVDILWRVAEAFAMTDRPGRARDVGVYILSNCQDPKERLATVQKAMEYLPDAELADLLALERTGADGRGEFAAVKADLARRRVGAAAKDKQVASPDDLAIIEQLARDGTKADDAVLLAGYLFQQGDAENSAKWYQVARTRADTPEIARGLAYALNALDRPAEAEAAAYKWRDAGPENKEAYLVVASALLAIDPPVKLEADVVARIAKTISDAKYPRGAQELGWYAYNTGQPLAAARWFTAALTWKPDDEPSAFGLALAYDKLGAKAAFQKVIKVWGPRSQRIALLADPKARAAAGISAADILPMPPSIADPNAKSAPVNPAPTDNRAAAASGPAIPGPDGTIAAEPQRVVATPAAATVVQSTSGGGGGSGGGGRRDCTDHVPPAQLAGASAIRRGWCLLDLNRPLEAADAFEAGMQSTTGRQRADAAYGKTLADLRAGLTDSAAISASAAPQDTKRAVEMRTEILTQRALAAYNDGRYVEALYFLDERSRIAPEQNDLLMVRGWSYFHLHRLPEAKRIFVAVSGTGSREALRALAALAADRNGANVGDVRDRR